MTVHTINGLGNAFATNRGITQPAKQKTAREYRDEAARLLREASELYDEVDRLRIKAREHEEAQAAAMM